MPILCRFGDLFVKLCPLYVRFMSVAVNCDGAIHKDVSVKKEEVKGQRSPSQNDQLFQ